MNMKRKPILLVVGFVILLGFGLQAQQPAAPGRQMDYESKLDSVRSYADYFTPAAAKKMTPDAEGFIRRWTLLNPSTNPTAATRFLPTATCAKISTHSILRTSLPCFPKTATR